ncbi:MAG TPA: hypothetical protein VNZ52_02860 [Candidatus Thermoplasmatota archaeon]|nr:hypothetical protein [Candidatus Thermoplasmatota archaeon]
MRHPLRAGVTHDPVRRLDPPDIMAMVNQYWERRLMEGREKDWT